MTICAGCGVKEASRLECPNCKKYIYWVSQDHFSVIKIVSRGAASHKAIHSILQVAAQAENEKNSTLPANMRGYKFTGPMRPVYPLSPKRIVPAHIGRPDYADHPNGFSQCEMVSKRTVTVSSPEDIEKMRKVCKLAREVLDIVASHVKPGVTTDELDRICHEECIKRDSYPSPLNYNGFPKSICTSVNEVICHGIPDQRPLLEGDIINLDVTLYHDGFHGDLNATYPVGKVDEESRDLIEWTKKATMESIAICKPGVAFRDIGNKIEEIIKQKGYGIVRKYTGHGINRLFHTVPNVVHYGGSKMAGRMEAGQIFTIEPMINLGTHQLEHWKDDWTAVTLDGRKSAQFEETILITETGVEILTRAPATTSSSSSKKKKKKNKSKANGEMADGTQTPTNGVAEGMEDLKVNGEEEVNGN